MSTEKTLRRGRRMRIHVSILLLVLLGIALSGCFPFRLPADYCASFCTSINGTVNDSAIQEALEGVSVNVYCYELLTDADSTDSAGAYHCGKIKLKFVSSPEEVRKRREKPPIRRELELSIIFEKPSYKMSELLIPVEFVYCSPHPQPAPIPDVKIPDVFLVRE